MSADRELLHRYAREGDEAAFAEIVRRQTDLVYSVALRVTANGALAQEVTQTVFALLARRAAALAHYDTLVGWLHTTTRHTAINAVRGEERRRHREQEATAMQITDQAPTMDWEQLRPILDEAVGGLREDDRKAVLLRFFKNLSHQEVGAELGLSEDTARKRVERALEKLRNYFARRGVTTTAAILAGVISANSVQAAPAGLVANVTKVALLKAGGISAGGTGLAAFFTFLMNTKTKTILSASVLMLLALLLTVKLQSDRQRSSAAEAPPSAAAAAPVSTTATSSAPAPAPVPAPAASFVAPTPAQVQPPAVKPADVLAAPASTGVAGAADPQREIGTAMTDFVSLLQSGDYIAAASSYLQIPPQLTGQQLVEALEKNPDFPNTIQMMINATMAAQTATPVYNETGDLVTYKLTEPTNGKTMVRWKKIDGKWYVDAFE